MHTALLQHINEKKSFKLCEMVQNRLLRLRNISPKLHMDIKTLQAAVTKKGVNTLISDTLIFRKQILQYL